MTRAASLLLALVLATPPAAAQTLGLHLATAHQRGGYQAATPGLYWRSAGGCTLGWLRNSEGTPSLYAARTWQHGPWALTAGAISGYRSAPLSPLLVPSLRAPLAHGLALRLSLIPKARRDGSSALHLSIEW
jgi:hypothetical protein